MLTGCWDRREIEERTSVVGIAIDKSTTHPDMVLLTVQIPIPIKIAGSGGGKSGGGGKEAVKIMSSEGRTVLEAFQNLQKRLNQELFYGHTRVIAIGEALAKEGVNPIFDPFRRTPQIRRLLWPLVVKGDARELLQAGPNLEQIPIVYVMTMIENGTKTGRLPDMNLGNFYIDLSSKSSEPYLNYMEVHGDDIKWSGIAVFKRDKMVGTLSEDEAWSLLMMSEKKDGGYVTFPYKGRAGELVTVSTEYIKSKKQISFTDGRPVVRIKVFLEGNLLEKTFPSDLFKASEISQLQEGAEAYLNKEAKDLIHKLQKDYKSDILGIGDRLRSYYPKQWKQMNWSQDFPYADIVVTYDLKIRNTGMEMR
ncbi:Ger(x)C family spore germination protein [Paenibacillus cremeus]|uniref:Ger(X)C family spore germination protein n=2 Tax=Paenibacillus cremeus TaxID=2163881 RepID=A0A559K8N7_9BACL|nr:Ger(x)C family spore germination protein [Paenibacillus cremeus]